ncbi:MAG: hypothetical protein JO316_23240 [Abitibacteriaceae bacterium]|nr:hypothetical protein [Abditibacteriaceae bacterium]MBV9868280.1 hypothetical protein [Abditibacteriaceae bacterium]
MKKEDNNMWALLLAALATGPAIAWMDTRPHWDDTAISAAALFLGCAVFGSVRPKYAWLWALLIGAWIPAVGIARYHNYGTLLALAFAVAGAYSGALSRNLLARADDA